MIWNKNVSRISEYDMSNIYRCHNMNCSVSLYKKSHPDIIKLRCPQCKLSDIEHITFNEGSDEFFCSNFNCPEYQINPIVIQNSILTCPFCRSKNISIKKHDIV